MVHFHALPNQATTELKFRKQLILSMSMLDVSQPTQIQAKPMTILESQPYIVFQTHQNSLRHKMQKAMQKCLVLLKRNSSWNVRSRVTQHQMLHGKMLSHQRYSKIFIAKRSFSLDGET